MNERELTAADLQQIGQEGLTLSQVQDQLEKFLKACPKAMLLFDTAHHAVAGDDSIYILKKYKHRLKSLHVKDAFLVKPELSNKQWSERGRFCELGAGNVGLDWLQLWEMPNSQGCVA